MPTPTIFGREPQGTLTKPKKGWSFEFASPEAPELYGPPKWTVCLYSKHAIIGYGSDVLGAVRKSVGEPLTTTVEKRILQILQDLTRPFEFVQNLAPPTIGKPALERITECLDDF